MRYLGDLEPDQTFDCGTVRADSEEMVQFARRYDPQPIHLDPEAATETPFGGIVASGWYTVGLCMRTLVESVLTDIATTGARGVDRLRWPSPVRPGDELAIGARVLDVRETSDMRGVVELEITADRVNSESETALTMVGLVYVSRR